MSGLILEGSVLSEVLLVEALVLVSVALEAEELLCPEPQALKIKQKLSAKPKPQKNFKSDFIPVVPRSVLSTRHSPISILGESKVLLLEHFGEI